MWMNGYVFVCDSRSNPNIVDQESEGEVVITATDAGERGDPLLLIDYIATDDDGEHGVIDVGAKVVYLHLIRYYKSYKPNKNSDHNH
jgi:hypothetical protein